MSDVPDGDGVQEAPSLESLDGEESKSGDAIPIFHLDSSVRSCIEEFKTNGKQAAVDRAFAEMDIKRNGQLDKSEITTFMEEAAKVVKLQVNHDLIEDAVEALLEDVGCIDHITKDDFNNIFERHPDLLRCFDDEVSVATRRRTCSEFHQDELQEEEQENLEAWSHAHTHWKSQKVFWIWAALYVAANITAFAYKGYVYANNQEAHNVFGNCIIVARGSAQCLNLNCSLILFPVCRHLLTRFRATRLRFFFPFDAALECHIYIGIGIAILVTMHVSAHICDFYRFARADESDKSFCSLVISWVATFQRESENGGR